jgi:perosamine synthetase
MGLIKIPEESILYFKENVDNIYESGFLAEGPWNKKLSEFINELTGSEISVPTNSNGSGIVSLLQIYNHYYKRTEVFIQSNTMIGVKTMIPAGGCKLSGFIDSRIETLMPGLAEVKKALLELTPKQKSHLIILLSHIGGIINPDIYKISDLCKDEGIILIEDCAHSFGATLNRKHSGLFGDAGVYSFYSTKAIPAGEGGMLVTNNEELGKLAMKYSIYDRFDQKMDIGFNNRISEIQALFTYSVIKEWRNIISDKQQIAKQYIDACKELGINYISQESDGMLGNYYKFVIYNTKFTIDKFLPDLKTITSQVYDYSIGVKNHVINYHACLPIWFGQELQITEKVISELYKSRK